MNCGPKVSQIIAFSHEQTYSIENETDVAHWILTFMDPNLAPQLLNLLGVLQEEKYIE